MKQLLLITGLAAALAAGPVLAQDDVDEGLDLTITLMPEGAELPEVVTALIELPKDENGEYIPSAEGVANSADGLDTANRAREDGRAFGEAAAAAAQDNREDAGRGSMPDLGDLLPDHVPEIPELPGPPAPPIP